MIYENAEAENTQNQFSNATEEQLYKFIETDDPLNVFSKHLNPS